MDLRWVDAVCARGLEGVVGKRFRDPYKPARTSHGRLADLAGERYQDFEVVGPNDAMVDFMFKQGHTVA